ncbi:MAG: PEP-CTERM sorting domain-containing protein [Acidipila sp.]|nr:PEP-CTERM sorting domain-containing protein [Acidipila sp.]
MKADERFPRVSSRFTILLMLAITVFLLSSEPARANTLTISIQSPSSVNAGTSGNGLDIFLTNFNGPAVSIAAFTFEISTSSAVVAFTGADTATQLNPYIFAGNSLFGPNITVANTGGILSASDIFGVPAAGVLLGAGATVGLGRLWFNVSSTATSQLVNLTFTGFPATGLSDEFGNNVAVATLTGGQVNIIATTTPEPSSLTLMLTAVPLFWGWRKLRPGR